MVAVCLCAVVAGVSLALFSGPAGPAGRTVGGSFSPAPASIPAAQMPAPGASSRGTAAPAGTIDGIAKTALRLAPGLKHQMLAWKTGSGGAALSAVTADVSHAMQDAGLRLYVPMRNACKSLGSSIDSARNAPPIPDQAMQQLYAKARTGLSGAAADCQNAITIKGDGEDTSTQVNSTLLNQSRAEFAAKNQELYTATAAILGPRS